MAYLFLVRPHARMPSDCATARVASLTLCALALVTGVTLSVAFGLVLVLFLRRQVGRVRSDLTLDSF